MNRLIGTELLKLRTTRTTIALAVVALSFAVVLGLANAATAGNAGMPVLGSTEWVENVLGVSTIPAAVALLLGILLAAGEYQHHTITNTFLVSPRRTRVVVAKALAAAIAGSLLAGVMVVAAVAATLPSVLAGGAAIDAVHWGPALTIIGLLVASALLGALGALLGLLVRSQVAAVVAVVAWFTVVEAIAGTVIGAGLRQWLPGAAAADLAGSGGQPLWTAALVVGGWTAGVALLATSAVVRRDVT